MKINEKYELDEILSIEDYSNGETFDIEVDDVHLFTARNDLNGYESISHNSATICVFSPDDNEMLNAKTGSWFIENPQRGRSNNSVMLVRDKTTKEDFEKIMESVKEFGEPGFVFADDEGILVNPCVEIGFYPLLDIEKLSKENLEKLQGCSLYKPGKRYYSGWQACNLCEINGRKMKTPEDLNQAARAASIIGTMQADYTTFPYLGVISELLVEDEALLGVSMTGMMDSPEILFDPKIQRSAAKEILKQNSITAGHLGINECARATCVKPAGTSSCVLGSSSGIHPHHAKRYFRRVQANKLEFPVQEFKKHNPLAIEESVWSSNKTDLVITFVCEVPQGSIVKNQLSAVELLDKVKLTQQNWVESGTRIERCTKDFIRHNVSNTITVKSDEWDTITDYIYKNRKWFAGISLLPESGDMDYPQAPFTTVYTELEIAKMYGPASVLGSGLVVDGLHAFDNNLWSACDCVLGIGEKLDDDKKQPVAPVRPVKNGYAATEYNKKLIQYAKNLEAYYNDQEVYDGWYYKKDWIRRANQFADRYFGGDAKQMTYCLKALANWKLWLDLKREYKEIDWSTVVEESAFYENVDTMGAAACAGGACSISREL